jgi:hypothetical protein
VRAFAEDARVDVPAAREEEAVETGGECFGRAVVELRGKRNGDAAALLDSSEIGGIQVGALRIFADTDGSRHADRRASLHGLTLL